MLVAIFLLAFLLIPVYFGEEEAPADWDESAYKGWKARFSQEGDSPEGSQ